MLWFSKIWNKDNTNLSSHHQVKLGIPTIRFDPTRVTKSVEQDIYNTLISTIEFSEVHVKKIFPAALVSVRNGRDLAHLNRAIASLHLEGLNSSRSAEICRLVHNRASSLMERTERLKLGLKKSVWMYGAPCIPNMKNYSKNDEDRNNAHKSANRSVFDTEKGMFILGKWVHPGCEIGCKCVSRAVVLGL